MPASPVHEAGYISAVLCRLPGYSKIVTRPMAFSIMWERFHKGEYMTWEELQADLNQMFRNAMTYNQARDCVPQAGKPLLLQLPCSPLSALVDVPAHLGQGLVALVSAC